MNFLAIANLPKILVQEEIETHRDKDNNSNDILSMLHNDALRTLSLEHIVSKVDIPMCEDLKARLDATKRRISELKKIKQQLLTALDSP